MIKKRNQLSLSLSLSLRHVFVDPDGVIFVHRISQEDHTIRTSLEIQLDPMHAYQTLNIWLNVKNNSSRKRIKNRGMSCNRLCIPTFVV